MRLYVASAILAVSVIGVAFGEETIVKTRTDVYEDEWITATLSGASVAHEVGAISLETSYSIDVLSGATQTFTVDTISSATTFEETRHQVDLSANYAFDEERSAGGFMATSRETDFISNSAGINGSIELLERMVKFGFSYGITIDQLGTVHDPDVWERAETHTLNLDWNQILSPRATTTFLLTASTSQCGEVWGCQASPYRYVPIEGNSGIAQVISEHNPDSVSRGAIAARMSLALGSSVALHALTQRVGGLGS